MDENTKLPVGLWIEPNKKNIIDVSIFLYVDESRLRAVTLDVNEALKLLGLNEIEVKSTWTCPTREQLTNYRIRATDLTQIGSTVINRDKVSEFLVKYHLKTLDLTSPDGLPLELKRNSKGILSNETMELLQKLHPTFFDTLVIKFANESALVF